MGEGCFEAEENIEDYVVVTIRIIMKDKRDHMRVSCCLKI